MRGVRDKLNPTENPYEKSNIYPHEKPNGNQSNLPLLLPLDLPCCRRRICLAAIARSNPNGLRLTWVCVEVKFFGLFMEFSGLLMEFSGKEWGKRRTLDRWRKMRKRRKRKKIHCVRERMMFRKATLLQAYNVSGKVKGMGRGERERESNFFYYFADVSDQDWLV